MVEQDFDKLRNFNIDTKDYKGNRLFTSEVLENTKFELVKILDELQTVILYTHKLSIHCLWEKGGHVSNSTHYRGIAADFHIEPKPKNMREYMLHVALVQRFIEQRGIDDKCGFGVYPDWNNKGFHLDLRGKKARWGYIGNQMKGFEETVAYIKSKYL